MYKILIADDHSAIRLGMKVMVQNIFPTSRIDAATDTAATIEKMKADSYDLLLLDINMPDSDPVSVMQWIASCKPATKVLIFSMNPEELYGKRFLQLGARGYLPKSAPEEEIARALQLVMNNKKYVSPELADLLSEEIISGKSSNPFEILSAREFEIAICLLKGHSLNEICSILNIQYSTVSTHKQKIFEKLKVNNILHLSEIAKSYDMATV
jgi:two-component system, NarL family, invasion response regulator UvrY